MPVGNKSSVGRSFWTFKQLDQARPPDKYQKLDTIGKGSCGVVSRYRMEPETDMNSPTCPACVSLALLLLDI